jgi:hypothetical protein
MPGGPNPFAIGARIWPGLGKLVEEAGETLQVAGKIMAFPKEEHPDRKGPLGDRLALELGDLSAVIDYVTLRCLTTKQAKMYTEQRRMKYERFQAWHKEERKR